MSSFMGSCHVCLKASAFRCHRCEQELKSDEYSIRLRGYYCSSHCQTEDEANHNILHGWLDQRRYLYRAGKLAQQIFLILREKKFNMKILEVREGRDKLDINVQSYALDVFLQPFTEAPGLQDKHKAAILSWGAGHEALRDLQYLMQKLLPDRIAGSDIQSKMQEGFLGLASYPVDINISSARLRNLLKLKGRSHCFWFVDTALGVYVIDLCAAQFGRLPPVTRVDEYKRMIRGSTYPSKELGHIQKMDGEVYLQEVFPVPAGKESLWIRGLFELNLANELMKGVNAGVDHWESTEISLAEMLRLPQDEFGRMTERFCRHFETLVDQEMEKLHQPDGMLMKVNGISVMSDHLLPQYGLQWLQNLRRLRLTLHSSISPYVGNAGSFASLDTVMLDQPQSQGDDTVAEIQSYLRMMQEHEIVHFGWTILTYKMMSHEEDRELPEDWWGRATQTR